MPSLRLLAGVALLCSAATTTALCAEVVSVTKATLDAGMVLPAQWAYRPVPPSKPGSPPESTAGWSTTQALLPIGGAPDDWSGAAWFAQDLEVAPEVVGVEQGLFLGRHYGASRIYLDDRLIAETGALPSAPGGFRALMRPDPILFSFEAPGRHELRVLYANPDLEEYHRVGYPGGFFVRLEEASSALARVRRVTSQFATERALFASVYLAFALLHLLLFAFRRESSENLYFSVLCVCLAIVAFLLAHKALMTDPETLFWSEGLMNVGGLGFAASGVLFVHRVFSTRLPRYLRWALIGVALLLPFSIMRPGDLVPLVFLGMLAGLLEMARCVTVAAIRRREGARIVGSGILVVAAGIGAGVLANLGILPPMRLISFTIPFGSVLALIVSMSVYLSRHYALTHRRLEEQLERVQQLSEERLAQERRERQQEVRTRLLEAEVERKAQELEEARQLQLSMLPRTIPELPKLQIAAHMTTATEVGGDYYDFDLDDDGVLTVAVGDATGHGMRAGTMVTATKSLFNALVSEPDVVDTVKRSNLALKRMNLRNLNMALLLGRYREGRLQVVAAGMPQPLIYRAESDEVETLEIGGMPLGSLESFPYRSVEIELGIGDVVLMVSDGLPERRNRDDEELGYDAMASSFLECGKLPVPEIVEHLVAVGERWAAGIPADDDVTLVVLGVR